MTSLFSGSPPNYPKGLRLTDAHMDSRNRAGLPGADLEQIGDLVDDPEAAAGGLLGGRVCDGRREGQRSFRRPRPRRSAPRSPARPARHRPLPRDGCCSRQARSTARARSSARSRVEPRRPRVKIGKAAHRFQIGGREADLVRVRARRASSSPANGTRIIVSARDRTSLARLAPPSETFGWVQQASAITSRVRALERSYGQRSQKPSASANARLSRASCRRHSSISALLRSAQIGSPIPRIGWLAPPQSS